MKHKGSYKVQQGFRRFQLENSRSIHPLFLAKSACSYSLNVSFVLVVEDLVKAHIERSIATKERVLENCLQDIVAAGKLIAAGYKKGAKLLCCGNGGSAGDAQHIATEFLIRYSASHERDSLPALSLAADSSALTAGGNDFGFENIFARQIEGLAQKGDILLGITTSGNSQNIIEALKSAHKKEMRSIILTGAKGGKILKEYKDLVEENICIPTEETARIQEAHIMVGQIFCAIVEKELYGYS